MAQPVARPSEPPNAARKGAAKAPRQESNRDLVEQVVVALILAFLIRGFEAEAFVIPTGSMAPTLMGRHKEVACPECGQTFPVNASDEVEGQALAGRVVAGTCSNCRFQARIDEAPSFKGDRILVMKFLYSLPFLPGGGEPNRWDVVVFKYPEEPEVNYIKRLVGLPGEILRVYFGDILTKPRDPAAPFRLQRRPLEHQQAMQMLVYDDGHRPKSFAGMPDWQRWRSKYEGTWAEPVPGQFHADGKAADWNELRYRHLVPDPVQWESVLAARPVATPPRPSLITDFYSYNSNQTADRTRTMPDYFLPHWVGDLTLSCKIKPEAASGQVRLELVEGGVANRCEIDWPSVTVFWIVWRLIAMLIACRTRLSANGVGSAPTAASGAAATTGDEATRGAAGSPPTPLPAPLLAALLAPFGTPELSVAPITFMPRKTARFSGAMLTSSPGVDCNFGRSLTGTSWTKSTSPDTACPRRCAASSAFARRRAATRTTASRRSPRCSTRSGRTHAALPTWRCSILS